MTIGHFAGAFADAWASGAEEAAERKNKDQFAKLQAQLLEIQLKGAKTTEEAQQRVDDMMGGITRTPAPGGTGPGLPRQEINLGTPGEPVPNTTGGMNVDEMMKSPQGVAAMIASGQLDLGDLLREQGLSEGRDLQAGLMEQFFGEGGAGSSGMVPTGISIGADGTPQLSFGPDPRQTPLTGEQSSLYVNPKNGEPAPPGKTREAYEEGGFVTTQIYEARQNKRRIQDNATVDLQNAQDIVALQTELDKFAPHLAPGAPAPDLQRTGAGAFQYFKDLFGGDTKKARDFLAKRDELEKKMSIGVLTSISAFNEIGTVTDVKFDQIRKSNPNMGIESAANNQIIAGQLQELLMEAERTGVPLQNRDEIESFIREIKGQKDGAVVPVTDDAGAIRAIGQMNAEQLDVLMQNPDALKGNPEALNAAEKRWNELNAGN